MRPGSRREAEGVQGANMPSRSPEIGLDADGNLIRLKTGAPVVPEGEHYDFQIANVSRKETRYKNEPTGEQWSITFNVLGTEQPFGQYVGQPFQVYCFVALPKQGKLMYKADQNSKELKMTKAATFLESLGFLIKPTHRVSDIEEQALIGLYAHGGVLHTDSGFCVVEVPSSKSQKGLFFPPGKPPQDYRLKPLIDDSAEHKEMLNHNLMKQREVFLV